MVEITPEMKKQLEEQKKNCPFCKIIAGEIESKTVYKDDLMIGILDINPSIKGHTIVMPKDHFPIMPFLPPETFNHMFGMMPKLIAALKKSMLTTGANIFIANGGIAGQQSPHFLIHLLPRERGDSIFDMFLFNEERHIEKEKYDQIINALANNIPMMMNNHFGRNPASWHNGNIQTAQYLQGMKKVYEDEKAFVSVPDNPQCLGHLVIYSNEEENHFENLGYESSSHLFYVASFCATAVFEGLGAQGSNIVLKTGESDDNPDGRLEIHILPRFPEDGIDILPKPLKEKPNLDQVAAKIKDETFMIEYELKERNKEEKIIDLDKKETKVIQEAPSAVPEIPEKKSFDTPHDEIAYAIRKKKENH